MEAPSDVVMMMEEREELMISPVGGNHPALRTAHFLNPSVSPSSSVSSPESHFPAPSKPTFFNPTKTQLSRLSCSHRHPPDHWNDWVDCLRSIYRHVWIQAGIHDAILSSTRKIPKDNGLIMGLAERWNSNTNTFFFPWGEATLTLEDMVLLGGYSVLGDSVLSPLATLESTEICSSLKNARREIRLSGTGNVTHQAWMDYFRATGNKLEHEAFLVLWLSRFVLTQKNNYITSALFPIAIHLSKGIKIALAPAVLASVYRDFRLLKRLITDACTPPNDNGTKSVLETPLSSPLQLVLLWARKRFCGEPRLGRQHGWRKLDFMNVREFLDSAGECFLWRPYGIGSSNSMLNKLYKENGEWVLVEANMGEELESYARCLRVSALVGLDCIEQYFPHRVAMQFGFDQDVPGHVTSLNGSAVDAWINYKRPIIDVRLYIPPCLFESDVTLRYVEWLKGSISMADSCKGVNVVRRKRRSTNLKRIPRISWGFEKLYPHLVLPVPTTTFHREEAEDYIDEDEMMTTELVCYKSKKSTSRDTLRYADESLLKPHTESASSSVANEINFRQIESSMEPVKMSVSSAGTTKRRMEGTDLSEPKDASSLDKLKRGTEEADLNEQKDTLASIVNNEERSSRDDTIELAELDIEVRISRLERVVAALKAAKLKGKLQKKKS